MNRGFRRFHSLFHLFLLVTSACAPKFIAGGNGIVLGVGPTVGFYDPESNYAKISSTNKAATQLIGTCTSGSTVYISNDALTTILGAAPCVAGEFTISLNLSSYADGTVTLQGVQVSSAGVVSSAYTPFVMTKETAFCDAAGNRVAGSFPAGTGTAGDPYLICTADQLTLINAAQCTSGAATTFRLMDDIDLSAYANWTPLCTSGNDLQGTFDGGHYRVDGLTITSYPGLPAGLFGRAAATSAISNLRIRGATIANNSFSLGAVAGVSDGTSSRVSTRAIVTNSSEQAGGVFGASSGSISNIWSVATVTGSGAVGGLVGSMSGGSLTDGWSRGTMTTSGGIGWQLGGIVGGASGTAHINRVSSSATVVPIDAHAHGGIVGRISNTAIVESAVFTGSIVVGAGLPPTYIGGIAGIAQNATQILKSSFTGTITCDPTSTAAQIGGILAEPAAASTLLISQSFSSGTINCPSVDRVGGLIGTTHATSTATISDSYSTTSITADNFVGGLIGGVAGAVNIDRSYSNATITAGGVTVNAIAPSGTVTDVYFNTDRYATSAIGTGLSDALMRIQGSFTGFTFDATNWRMGTGAYPYPELYWQ